jgi:D-3-phosphoglycerate dehydrogenase
MTRRKILCMVDLTAYPQGLSDLQLLGEVIVLPARQNLLMERIGEFDGFLTPITLETSQEVLTAATRLQVIASASTGTDHIDIAQAQRQGVTVLSLKDDADLLNRITATAEMAWALLLATVRKLPAAVDAAMQGNWDREQFRGTQLSGKVLGILGYGRLGKMVGRYGKAFGMEVLACDRSTIEVGNHVTQVDLETLLQRSDVISIHVHLSDETRGLFDSDAFSKMKPGAFLVNTSRGAIIDERAILDALNSGRLTGAGLDVIDGERGMELKKHPLLKYASEHDNLVISPHIGGATVESQTLAIERTIQKLANFLEHGEMG